MSKYPQYNRHEVKNDMTQFYEQVKERMIRYAKVDTQSMAHSDTVPSTMKQFDLARLLYEELKQIGASEVYLDEEKCVVYGKIPANTEGKPLGLIAHMDTAPDASGKDVKPWVLENYDGGDIVLNKEQNIVMKAEDYENLSMYIGQDLILTDGTTLLGGDDKASISAIMTMAEYLITHPEIPRGLISIAFTPDEEVGGLARDLDLKRFESPAAYTLDGDHLGYYEDETFNASEAIITLKGVSVHTGTAKGIMKNAVDIGTAFLSRLPMYEKPQYTDAREGFYHAVSFNATCETGKIVMIIRDHDSIHFAQREDYLRKITEALQKEYGEECIALEIIPQYRSMKEVIDTVPWMMDNLIEAIESCGVQAKSLAFRGGTDGSALSQRGLPCPNLSAGYENAHGRFEYVPVQSMEKNVEILLKLAEICAGTN